MRFQAELRIVVLRSMAFVPVDPCANAIVGSNEILSNRYGIITIGDTTNHFSIYVRPTIPASIVGTQRVGERPRWH